MLDPRYYQRDSIDALYDYWASQGGNGLIVLPTGAGKSLVIALLCKELLERFPDMRIGIVTHVKELVGQNRDEIVSIWPSAPVGIYSAGLGRRDTRAQILFMGIQSVHKKAEDLGRFDLLIVDEAHLIPSSSDTMYGRFIRSCKDIYPDMRIVGLTATPWRLSSGMLHQGKGAMFDKIVYEANVRDLISDGFLSNLISKATKTRIDTTGLHRRAGEYIASEMDQRVRVPSVVELAVREIVEYGADRKGWLAFCVSVKHAEDVCHEIRSHGISCAVITGETDSGVRDQIIKDFKAKRIRCLCSVGVLTTGFNARHVDLIALLRPTLSSGLYLQMIGRGFRLADGKEDCLILDFAGLVLTHGPVDDVRPRVVRSGGGKKEIAQEDEPRGKECPVCSSITGSRAMTCLDCGYEWPVPHEARPAEVEILSNKKPKPNPWKPVDSVSFMRHTKIGSPPSLRVRYNVGLMDYSDWKCFEHTGYAREKAHMWWRAAGGSLPCPATVDEALERIGELRAVSAINVDDSGKYATIRSVLWRR